MVLTPVTFDFTAEHDRRDPHREVAFGELAHAGQGPLGVGRRVCSFGLGVTQIAEPHFVGTHAEIEQASPFAQLVGLALELFESNLHRVSVEVACLAIELVAVSQPRELPVDLIRERPRAPRPLPNREWPA